MPTATQGVRLAFPAARTVHAESFTPAAPGTGQVLIRSRWSLMSTGTETIVYGRRFDPGTHWDHWVRYPFYPGYASVGQVAAVGPQVEGLAVGAWVACRAPHASHAVVAAQQCHRVPEAVDRREAAWFALAKIVAMGVRAAPFAFGDRVLVIGAGPIGQMCVRWALATGAERVVALDTVDWRLAQAAAAGGAETIACPVGDAAAVVAERFGASGPNLVIDATGHHEVLPHALRLVGQRGTVLIIGDTGRPASQHLSSDMVTRGLRIVGAHDGNEDQAWNSGRIIPYFFALVASGRFRLGGLATEVYPPSRCAEAYELADARRGHSMGIFFDWSSI